MGLEQVKQNTLQNTFLLLNLYVVFMTCVHLQLRTQKFATQKFGYLFTLHRRIV